MERAYGEVIRGLSNQRDLMVELICGLEQSAIEHLKALRHFSQTATAMAQQLEQQVQQAQQGNQVSSSGF